jgi:hypothetical protein
MPSAFDTYLRARAAGERSSANAFQMRQAAEGIRRQGELRNILQQHYTPEQVGPMQPGIEREPASFNRPGATSALLGGGFIKEAQEVASPFGTTAPSAVREYEFWKKLKTPEAQEQYLALKRTQQIKDIAGVPTVIPQVIGGDVTPLSTLDEEAAAKARLAAAQKTGTLTGEDITTAKLEYPALEASTGETLNIIEQLRTHPGKGYAVGPTSMLPIPPGTDAAGFMALYNQATGKIFMEAYQKLKGGGQITEIEGTKAEQAMAKMSRSQSEKDFNKGLDDFESVIKSGLARAKKKVGVGGPKVGTIQGGYVYMGGDPANSSSWKKQ